MKTKKTKIEIIFSLFLLLMFLIFLIIASSYDRQTRMFPFIIGIPGLILSIILFSSYYIPAVSRRISTIKQKEFFKTYDREEEKEDDEKKKKELKKALLKELNITIWIIALLVTIYIMGFMMTVPLFIFLFLKFREKENLKVSILISAGSWAVIYVMFRLVLGAQLYGGMLF